MEKLEMNDILDLREYERIRETYRDEIITIKKFRRIHVGEIITVLFENRETVKFQIQEMARAEKIISDEGIEEELSSYNSLIPDAGHLKATLFIELVTDDEVREWLPKLVGIEKSIYLLVGDNKFYSKPEKSHEDMLTRQDVTASVHYIDFDLSSLDLDNFKMLTLSLGIDHEALKAETLLRDETRSELLRDLSV